MKTSTFESIVDTDIVAVVGPTAIGKSAVVRHLRDQYPDQYHQIGSFTTRPPRDGERPDAYEFITDREYDELHALGKVVQCMKHVTNGLRYGSLLSHYDPTKVNVGDFAFNSIDAIKDISSRVVTVGIVAANDALMERIDKRWKDDDTERFARIAEAQCSLRWIERHADIVIDTTDVSNRAAAIKLDALVKGSHGAQVDLREPNGIDRVNLINAAPVASIGSRL